MEVLYQLSYVGNFRLTAGQWGEQDSNLRRLSQRIYSPSPLATRTSPRALEEPIVDSRPVDVRPIEPGEHAEVARIVTDALLHDPGWLAVGPNHTKHRRFVAMRYHRAAVGVVHRHGGPIYGAFRDGRLAGTAVTFAAGSFPPPARTFFNYVPAFAAAGPAPVVRALKTMGVQDNGHPHDEHVFLWFLAVDPAHQRSGVGRALLDHVFDEAEAPVYLDTANPDNVPYYASFGFEELGRAALPRGATMWFMQRSR
jgi:GNAT superfamily N-acetyltransferase